MKKLKYSLAPYIGLNIILLFVFILAISYSIRTHDYKPILFLVIMWFIFMLFWYIVMHGYKVTYDNETIYSRAADYRTKTSIKIFEITKIKLESKIVEIKDGSYRPNLRLSLYGEDKNHYVDISLRHFEIDSIRELMRYIHSKRPDLDIPKAYLKEKDNKK